jgi:hypothetical protein
MNDFNERSECCNAEVIEEEIANNQFINVCTMCNDECNVVDVCADCNGDGYIECTDGTDVTDTRPCKCVLEY